MGFFKKIVPCYALYIHIGIIIVYSLQIGRPRLREVKSPAQSYAFGKWLRGIEILPLFLVKIMNVNHLVPYMVPSQC